MMSGNLSRLKVVNEGCAQVILFDADLESYRPFFDEKWATGISRTGGWIEAGDARTQSLRQLDGCFVGSQRSLVDVYNRERLCVGLSRKREMVAAQVLEEHAALTLRQFCETSPSPTKNMRREVEAHLKNVGKELRAEVERRQELTRDQWEASHFWTAYLDNRVSNDFKLNIWGAQRVCYGAIYHAYENFVRDCIALLKGVPSFDDKGDKLIPGARSTLGKEIVECCLTDSAVTLAFDVRNALAHNGGRETERLRANEVRHGIYVEDGILQIVPCDTSNLFGLLKEKASALAERVVELTANCETTDPCKGCL